MIYRLWGKGYHLASISQTKTTGSSKMPLLTPFLSGCFRARESFPWRCLHLPRTLSGQLYLFGLFVGTLCFGRRKQDRPLRTKTCSWDGKFYFLNPALSLCVREQDIVVVNSMECGIRSLHSYWADTLRDVIYRRIITSLSEGPLRYLMENRILIEVK